MNHLPEKRISDFIKEHHVLTLATCKNEQAYCTNCFYTYIEEDTSFVFSSDMDTRHIQEVLENNKVAASILLETKTIGKIQGLQITGLLHEAQDDVLKKAKKAYLKAFPYAILKSTKLWVLECRYIKMTDNRLGFGKKLIWQQNKEA
jgi:hypothetical protein